MSTVLALLSIFKLNFFGSFIGSDAWIFAFFRNKAVPLWFFRIIVFIVFQLILSLLFRNVQDLLFNFRFGLIMVLSYLFSLKTPKIRIIGIGLLLLYLLLAPSNYIYFSSTKSVLAITPLLLLSQRFEIKKYLLTLILIPIIALYFDSRALLIGFTSYIIVGLYTKNRLFLIPLIALGVFGFILSFDSLVSEQWYSNLIRLTMITEGVKINSFNTFFCGMGYLSWREELAAALDGLGVSQRNLHSLNPHFLFVEMIIEWGWLGFSIFLRIFYRSLRNVMNRPLGISLITACVFTTNTGIERLFLAIGIGILWSIEE